MDEILKICNDLAFALKTALGRAGEITRENETKRAELDGREANILLKEENLNSRERKVSAIEDVVAMKESAVSLMKQANDLKDKTKTERSEFDRTSKDTLDTIAREKAALSVEKTRDLESKKELKGAWEQLRAKEKSYREDIQNEIKKRLG